MRHLQLRRPVTSECGPGPIQKIFVFIIWTSWGASQPVFNWVGIVNFCGWFGVGWALVGRTTHFETVYFILTSTHVLFCNCAQLPFPHDILCAKLLRRGPASGKNRSSAYLLRLPEAGGAVSEPGRSMWKYTHCL